MLLIYLVIKIHYFIKLLQKPQMDHFACQLNTKLLMYLYHVRNCLLVLCQSRILLSIRSVPRFEFFSMATSIIFQISRHFCGKSEKRSQLLLAATRIRTRDLSHVRLACYLMTNEDLIRIELKHCVYKDIQWEIRNFMLDFTEKNSKRGDRNSPI